MIADLIILGLVIVALAKQHELAEKISAYNKNTEKVLKAITLPSHTPSQDDES